MATNSELPLSVPATVRPRRIANPLVFGVLCAVAAAAGTAAYLALTTSDDALEALIYFPIVGFFLALHGAHSGYRRKPFTWPPLAATGATIAAFLTLIVIDLVQGRTEDLGSTVSTGIFHLIFAIAAAVCGWILGAIPARFRKPPPDPSLLRAGSR